MPAARRPFDIRKVVADQLPQIRTDAGGSKVAEQLAKNFEAISSITGHYADQQTKELSKEAGIKAARASEGGPPPLQSPMTLSGQSYNAAALDTYRAQLDNRAQETIDRITRENSHDPAKLSQELDAARKGYLSEIPEQAPALKADFESRWMHQQQASMDQAWRARAKVQQSAHAAAVTTQVENRVNGMERIATTAGVNRDARSQLTQEQAALEQLLVEQGPKGAFTYDGQQYKADPTRGGLYSPEQIQQLLSHAHDRVLQARVMGTFQNSADPQAFRDRFAADFQHHDTGAFKESPTTGLSRGQYEQLLGKMDSQLRSMHAADRTTTASLRSQVHDTVKLLNNGYSPGENAVNTLEAKVRETGDAGLLQDLARAKDLFHFHEQISRMTPVSVEKVVDGLRSDLAQRSEKGGQGANIAEFDRLQHAESFLSNMRQGLKHDPLGWANRVGLVSIDPVSFASQDPQQALQSMSHRRDQAQAVAEYYHVAPQYLTDQEASSLKSAFDQASIDQRLAILSNVQQGFGDATRSVMGQIADDQPVMAHLGGLLSLDNNLPVDAHLGVVRRALQGQQALNDGNRVLPADADLQLMTQDVLGNSLGHLPRVRSALIKTAKALYTDSALKAGVTSDLPQPDMWHQALQEAAGALYSHGERVGGGFAEFNGSTTLIPPQVQGSSDLADKMSELTPADLVSGSVGGEAPKYGNGETVPPPDILDHGRLVPIDVGKYLVDMSSDGTGFLAGSGPGGHYVLDLGALLPQLTRRAQGGGS